MLPGYEHLRNAMVEEKLDAVLAKEFPLLTNAPASFPKQTASP